MTEALVLYLPRIRCAIWEPAAGNGAIVAALRAAGFVVAATDVETGHDFLTCPAPRPFRGHNYEFLLTGWRRSSSSAAPT